MPEASGFEIPPRRYLIEPPLHVQEVELLRGILSELLKVREAVEHMSAELGAITRRLADRE